MTPPARPISNTPAVRKFMPAALIAALVLAAASPSAGAAPRAKAGHAAKAGKSARAGTARRPVRGSVVLAARAAAATELTRSRSTEPRLVLDPRAVAAAAATAAPAPAKPAGAWTDAKAMAATPRTDRWLVSLSAAQAPGAGRADDRDDDGAHSLGHSLGASLARRAVVVSLSRAF